MTVFKGKAMSSLVIAAGLVGTFAMGSTAYAATDQRSTNLLQECPLEAGDEPGCGGGDPGGGGGGGGGGGTPPPTYTLQGVIQNEGYQGDPNGVPHGARVKLRAYSRFANANNDRVDANFISVRCYAYDQLGGYTTDYDDEGNGALVDVHFSSNFVYGAYRTITVNCTHHANYGLNSYDTTSTTQINIPY